MNFDDLIGSEGLSPEDELRLRRVHDLLVQAGPPPDLSPELERPAVIHDETPREIPLIYRRRRGLGAVLALAAAIAAASASTAPRPRRRR